MNKSRHRWADVIIAMANGERVEFLNQGVWTRPGPHSSNNPLSCPSWEWRVAPKTIMIGDVKVPEPLTKFPEGTGLLYTPDIDASVGGGYRKIYSGQNNDWSNPYNVCLLNNRMLHATREAAITHAKALIKISGGTV